MFETTFQNRVFMFCHFGIIEHQLCQLSMIKVVARIKQFSGTSDPIDIDHRECIGVGRNCEFDFRARIVREETLQEVAELLASATNIAALNYFLSYNHPVVVVEHVVMFDRIDLLPRIMIPASKPFGLIF